MNSCVCDMPGTNHSLTKIKYSLPFLEASSLPLMSLSDFIFCCPSQLLLLFSPFGICPCFPPPTIPNLIAFAVQLKCHLLQEASSPRSSVLPTRTQITGAPQGAALCPRWPPLPSAWVRLKQVEHFSPPPRSTQKCPLGGDRTTNSQRK